MIRHSWKRFISGDQVNIEILLKFHLYSTFIFVSFTKDAILSEKGGFLVCSTPSLHQRAPTFSLCDVAMPTHFYRLLRLKCSLVLCYTLTNGQPIEIFREDWDYITELLATPYILWILPLVYTHNMLKAVGVWQRIDWNRWKATQTPIFYRNTCKNLCRGDGWVILIAVDVSRDWSRTLLNKIPFNDFPNKTKSTVDVVNVAKFKS